MAKSKKKDPIIFAERATYMGIFQNRPIWYRVVETVIFINFIFWITMLMPSDGNSYKILLFASLVIFLAGFPLLYKVWLAPKYTLTRNELVIQIGKKDTHSSLRDIKRASEYKGVFFVKGKKVHLMASKDFLDRLDDQLARVHKVKKR